MNNNKQEQLIEQAFKAEPEYQLPEYFAEKVTAELVRRTQWKIDLAEYLFLSGLAILLLTVVAGTYYYVNKEGSSQIYTFISMNLLPVGFAALLLNFILFADKVLLPLLFNRWKISFK